MRLMVTGAAGFIGTHLCARLIDDGHSVIGIDNFSDYYSPELKIARQTALMGKLPAESVYEIDLSEPASISELASFANDIDAIIHLAAQPGIRLPAAEYARYVSANLVALGRVFDFAVSSGVPHVLYASSSSVYGDGTPTPFKELAGGLTPTSFYGSTKLAGEELARGYTRAAPVAARGMRYFTVYGPWGRPDMAYFRLIAAALGEWSFTLTGSPEIRRDFTFVDDTVSSTIALLADLTGRQSGYHDVVNVGGGRSRSMGELVSAVSEISGTEIVITKRDGFAADMMVTEADFSLLESITNERPLITLEQGIEACLSWAGQPAVRSRLRQWIESTA